jgi:hypothetical protein
MQQSVSKEIPLAVTRLSDFRQIISSISGGGFRDFPQFFMHIQR